MDEPQSHENNRQGDAGERVAAALLKGVGFSVAQVRPDTFGTDLLATGWRGTELPPHLDFSFQVKSLESGIAKPVSGIRRSLFSRACDQPAFVLVFNRDYFQPRYWLAPVFEWTKANPAWAIGGRMSFAIQRSYFAPLESAASIVPIPPRVTTVLRLG